MNAVQVRDRADAGPDSSAATSPTRAARGVRAAQRLPAVRAGAADSRSGRRSGIRPLGYLMDRIYTRDAWMHRVDLAARPAGR